MTPESRRPVASYKLESWRQETKVTVRVLAADLNRTERQVWRYLRGQDRPRDEVRLAIEKLTRGEVPCGDWSR